MSTRIPSHPGGLIKRTYIEPLNLTVTEVAEALEVSPATLSRLLNEKIDLSPQMAVKLSKVLGRTPASWMNMQANHTLAKLATDPAIKKWKPSKYLSPAGLLVIGNSKRKAGAEKALGKKTAA
jgi:addiction module HigA family antidote